MDPVTVTSSHSPANRRLPYLQSAQAKHIFETSLEAIRQKYRFAIDSYVLMPEHVHLLVSEPEVKTLSVALQALKISVTRQLTPRPFWQHRFYDFNVFNPEKQIEKRQYMHRNPVVEGLSPTPKTSRGSVTATGLAEKTGPSPSTPHGLWSAGCSKYCSTKAPSMRPATQ